ncbi:hypothetical protein AB0L74_33740 [Streptomyces sp. NPDC052020]|uniref:hypothetical protein n=1 Tax=Streptomyces sp. NPDC052020 TaxID=3155677 RepID=UPI0034266C05
MRALISERGHPARGPRWPRGGLTWISTAQRVHRRTLAVPREDLRRGTPVVGLEPSCTAVFRSDAPELLPKDPLMCPSYRATREEEHHPGPRPAAVRDGPQRLTGPSSPAGPQAERMRSNHRIASTSSPCA